MVVQRRLRRRGVGEMFGHGHELVGGWRGGGRGGGGHVAGRLGLDFLFLALLVVLRLRRHAEEAAVLGAVNTDGEGPAARDAAVHEAAFVDVLVLPFERAHSVPLSAQVAAADALFRGAAGKPSRARPMKVAPPGRTSLTPCLPRQLRSHRATQMPPTRRGGPTSSSPTSCSAVSDWVSAPQPRAADDRRRCRRRPHLRRLRRRRVRRNRLPRHEARAPRHRRSHEAAQNCVMSSADALAAADATALAAGTKTPQQLIVGLPELASADEAERLPPTAHLAAVLSNLQSANTALPQAAADHILTFLTSRLHDYPCSAPVLGGLCSPITTPTSSTPRSCRRSRSRCSRRSTCARSCRRSARRRSRSRSRSRRNGGPRSRRRACGCCCRRCAPSTPRRTRATSSASSDAARAHAPLRRRAAGGARRRARRDLRRVGALLPDRVLAAARRPARRHAAAHRPGVHSRAEGVGEVRAARAAVAAGQARRRRPAGRDPPGSPGARAPRARVRRRRRRAARPAPLARPRPTRHQARWHRTRLAAHRRRRRVRARRRVRRRRRRPVPNRRRARRRRARRAAGERGRRPRRLRAARPAAHARRPFVVERTLAAMPSRVADGGRPHAVRSTASRCCSRCSAP